MRLNAAQFKKIKGDTMKRKLLAGIVAFGLTASMVTGSLYTVNGTGVVQAAELAARAEGRTWDLTESSAVERPNLQGNEGEYDGIRPGYHMNKRHWISVYFNSDVHDDKIKELVRKSYDLIVTSLPKRLRSELDLNNLQIQS